MLDYDDFDLVFTELDSGAHQVKVKSPSGDAGPVPFVIPFQVDELRSFMRKLGRSHDPIRDLGPPGLSVEGFGARLFDALFQPPVRDALNRNLGRIESSTDRGLRIRLRLADAPGLATLPWEFLYDRSRRRFLALTAASPVVRYPDLDSEVAPLPLPDPIRVLAVVADPTGTLDIEQEWQNITNAVLESGESHRIVVERLVPPTMRSLHRRLGDDPVHVLHFIGHGGRSDTGDDVLVLEDANGNADHVGIGQLTALSNNQTLRLVVLNACDTGRADDADPFAGLAQGLLKQHVPAVVAMQFPITDRAAIAFGGELYRGLARGRALDVAITQARNAIVADRSGTTEWATPVVFLQPQDGRVFTSDHLAPKVRQTHGLRLDPSPAARGNGTFFGAAVSPDASRLAAATGDGTAPLWRNTGGISCQNLYHGGAVWAVAFSPDGTWLATGSEDAVTRLWEADGGTLRRSLKHHAPVSAVAFSRSGRRLATLTTAGTATVWEVAGGQREIMVDHPTEARGVEISPDERWLSTRGTGGVRLWDLAAGAELHVLPHDGTVWTATISTDSRWIATAADDDGVRVWNVTTGRVDHVAVHDGWASTAAFSVDGRWLATGGRDHTARLWDVATWRPGPVLNHDGPVHTVVFQPDGWLATAGEADGVKFWDPVGGRLVHTVRPGGCVDEVIFTSDGRWFVTLTDSHRIELWDTADLGG